MKEWRALQLPDEIMGSALANAGGVIAPAAASNGGKAPYQWGVDHAEFKTFINRVTRLFPAKWMTAPRLLAHYKEKKDEKAKNRQQPPPQNYSHAQSHTLPTFSPYMTHHHLSLISLSRSLSLFLSLSLYRTPMLLINLRLRTPRAEGHRRGGGTNRRPPPNRRTPKRRTRLRGGSS